MDRSIQRRVTAWTMVTTAIGGLGLNPPPAPACGGFFCQRVPIDQAGEQIIFRRDGDQVTAVILIQYEGEAEDFSWVVPVPGVPELSTGSDLVFNPLELATRPQFLLERTGEPCPVLNRFGMGFNGVGASPSANGEDADDGVDILEELTVGPFDVQVVTSDDPNALATWLVDNGYDLRDPGPEIIATYVKEEMNFVALRLRQDQGIGDIQPLIMRYISEEPMIPIRLTAVAAQPDMGIIVWFLGEARAVPLNYLHVTPNYTLLNWYGGTFNAYASYQGLITSAMDEAGGQGFATDYAGRSIDLLEFLPSVEVLGAELTRLSNVADDAEMIAEASRGFIFPQDQVLEILRRELPLPPGQDEFAYQIPELLTELMSADELSAARGSLITDLNKTVIDPLAETLAVLDGDPYVTRLYTTLSPEEMTKDPRFSFNPDLSDQSLARNATLHSTCSFTGTEWTLTLGTGTGRDGEVVIEGRGNPPGFTAPVVRQDAVWRTEEVGKSGQPKVIRQKQFDTAQVIGEGAGMFQCGAGIGLCGSGTAIAMLFTMIGFRFMRGRGSQAVDQRCP